MKYAARLEVRQERRNKAQNEGAVARETRQAGVVRLTGEAQTSSGRASCSREMAIAGAIPDPHGSGSP